MPSYRAILVRALLERLLANYRPRAVINFAAESHVDRSIHGPEDFIQTNVVGSYHLLESVRNYWSALPETEKNNFRFLHVSTDEGYGLFGTEVREWLYVKNHCSAISRVLEAGRPGETCNVGGGNEKHNIEIVETVCALLDELRPKADGSTYATQITYVTDRPGHDRRYAIDACKLERELDWGPAETFETGIRKTVQWYLDNPEWVANVQSGAYVSGVSQQYAGSVI